MNSSLYCHSNRLFAEEMSIVSSLPCGGFKNAIWSQYHDHGCQSSDRPIFGVTIAFCFTEVTSSNDSLSLNSHQFPECFLGL